MIHALGGISVTVPMFLIPSPSSIMATPTMTAELAAKSLDKEQKARLHQVADLLLDIYQTLVDMRYIEPQALVRGPHTLSAGILATYKKIKLDPAIIYLYSIMPYIDETEAEGADFFQGGQLFNQLSGRDVERGRDPRYVSPPVDDDFEAEGGAYMYPWYTPLSQCGNHSSIIIYDAREHRIWIVDQIENSTTDPAICKGWYRADPGDEEVKEESNWGDSDGSDWEEEDEDEDDSDSDSDSDDDDEDEMIDPEELDGVIADQSEHVDFDEGFEQVEAPDEWELEEASAGLFMNQNSLERIRSRPAGDVLRDINRWHRELKEIPGQGEQRGGHWTDEAILRPLYLKNGWPDHFDPEAFDLDVVRGKAKDRARYHSEDPLKQVDCYKGWLEHSNFNIERYSEEAANAKNPNDEWKARYKVWLAEQSVQRNTKDLAEAREKAEKMCPGGVCQREQDLPLWEAEQLRVETQWARESAQRDQMPAQYKGHPAQIRAWEASRRRALRDLQRYEKAFDAAKADVDRLCPGRTFEEATGIKSLGREDTVARVASNKQVILACERQVQADRGFVDTIPADAPEARAVVEEAIRKGEAGVEKARLTLARSEKWLAEHGNTD